MHAVRIVLAIAFAGLALFSARPSSAEEPSVEGDEMAWLDDGVVRVGANLSLGGAITWLGPSGSDLNLVNNHDWGRQIQMSFYSGPVPYEPDGRKPKPHWAGLGWNPIQSGDCFGNRSKVLSHESRDGELHVVCRPMHWPLENVPGECTFESRIRLDGGLVRVAGRLNNARPDREWRPAGGQELPATYVNGPYWRLMTYTGDRPFTGGPLERIPQQTEPGFPWRFWDGTERWAALVNDEGWGLGVVMPATTRFCGGFAGKEGAGGTKDAPTGYIAPLGHEILDSEIVYDFEYVLRMGTLEEIRETARGEVTGESGPSGRDGSDGRNGLDGPSISSGPSGPPNPAWIFQQTRQGWYYADARDGGWPISGELAVSALPPGPGAPSPPRTPAMLSPRTFWRAEDAPILEIELAAPLPAGVSMRARWWRHGESAFAPESVPFELVAPERTASEPETGESPKPVAARARLADSPGYRGGILQLRIEFGVPAEGSEARSGVSPGLARIRAIRLED